MNILTKNRILQQGDEYRNNGEWKPVPKDNYGLQIQFTDYTEVRRPSEKPADSGNAQQEAFQRLQEQRSAEHAVSHLPTVVSTKAHLRETPETVNEERTEQAKPPASPTPPLPPSVKVKHDSGEESVVVTGVTSMVVAGTTSTHCNIVWDSKKEPPCRWIGRNGTFQNRGVNLQLRKDASGQKIVAMLPVGKRGEAKNAEIEFPVSAIPLMIDWLKTL